MIEAHIEPSEDGHGFAAVVKSDGKVIYNSETKHGAKYGAFELELDAQTHAKAWAEAEARLKPETEKLQADRRTRLGGEVLVLKAQAREFTSTAKELKDDAKTAESNAKACEDRIEALATHTESPRLRIQWDRKTPAGVTLVPEESAWSEVFEPAEVDSKQLSLPGTNWQVTSKDGKVHRAIGYGRVELELDGDTITIKLGAEEHLIKGTLAGVLTHAEGRKPAPKSDDTKADKPIEPKIGKLKDKQLRERLPHLGRAETLLGIYVLELERSKPRQRVLDALSNLANDHDDMRLAVDLHGLADNRKSTQIKPDRAAAALATIAGVPETRVLEQLVPVCEDPTIIDDLLDDELERGEESRDEVVTVLRQRLAELGGAPEDDETEDDTEDAA